MPSLKGYIHDSIRRLEMIKYENGLFNKLRIFILAIINSFPRTIRSKSEIVERIISLLDAIITRNIIININGIKYVLVDYESFYIVTPEFEPWMWHYLKPKKGISSWM